MDRAIVLLLAAGTGLLAQDVALQPGFDHFYNLEYDQAIEAFRAEAKAHPEDANAFIHVAQGILYRDMFRAGALESEFVTGNSAFLRLPKMNPSATDQEEFSSALNTALSMCEKRIERNPNDLQALYGAGVAHGLRANYNYLVKKAWVDALRDATAARKLHNKIIDLDPKFIDARLVQGVHDYLIGTLPSVYKMLGFLAGFHGDREAGIRSLQLVAEKGNLNRYDARVLLAAIYRREKRQREALQLLSGLTQRFPRNYLFRLEAVQMHGDLGEKDQALAGLQAIEALKRNNAPGMATLPLEKIYYYEGNLLFWYNDLDHSLELLRKASAKASTLDPNTGVFSFLRQGQIYDLKGDRAKAKQAYQDAIALAPASEAAKESRQYLNSPYRRGSQV